MSLLSLRLTDSFDQSIGFTAALADAAMDVMGSCQGGGCEGGSRGWCKGGNGSSVCYCLCILMIGGGDG